MGNLPIFAIHSSYTWANQIAPSRNPYHRYACRRPVLPSDAISVSTS